MNDEWKLIPWDEILTEEEQKLSKEVWGPVFMEEGLDTPAIMRPQRFKSLEQIKEILTKIEPNIRIFRWRVHYYTGDRLPYFMWWALKKV